MFTQSSFCSPSPCSNVRTARIGGNDRQVGLLDVEVFDVPVARVRRHLDDDVVLPPVELVRTVRPEWNAPRGPDIGAIFLDRPLWRGNGSRNRRRPAGSRRVDPPSSPRASSRRALSCPDPRPRCLPSPRLYFSAFLTSKRNPAYAAALAGLSCRSQEKTKSCAVTGRVSVPLVQPWLSGRMLNVQTEASSFGVNVSAQSGMALRSASKVRRPAATSTRRGNRD